MTTSPEQHPDGTSTTPTTRLVRDAARLLRRSAAELGTLTWQHILDEAYLAAKAESDPDRLRAELVQVAAVCAAWISDLDRRPAPAAAGTVEETR